MDQVPGCPLYSIENKFGVGGPGAGPLGTSSLLYLQWRLCLLCNYCSGTCCNFVQFYIEIFLPELSTLHCFGDITTLNVSQAELPVRGCMTKEGWTPHLAVVGWWPWGHEGEKKYSEIFPVINGPLVTHHTSHHTSPHTSHRT